VWEQCSDTFFGVGTHSHTFLHDPNDYVKTWLRFHRCASDMQIPTASKVYSETGTTSVEILVGELSLYLNSLVQSSFSFSVGTAFDGLLMVL